MNEEQRVNPPIMEVLKALVEALEALPSSIAKEAESWNPFGRFLAEPLVIRYEQDSKVLPKLVERVKAMMRACESSSATSLRESSQSVWGEIDRIIETGKEPLTPHGAAWVNLCRSIEASVIRSSDEVLGSRFFSRCALVLTSSSEWAPVPLPFHLFVLKDARSFSSDASGMRILTFHADHLTI